MVGAAFMTPVYLLVDWRHKCRSYQTSAFTQKMNLARVG